MIPLLSLTEKAYTSAIVATLGKGVQHARLLYREWFQTGSAIGRDPHFKNAKHLLKQMLEISDFSVLPLIQQKRALSVRLQARSLSPDKLSANLGEIASKHLLQTHDGLQVEMVVLPMQAGNTLCISSQVGCRMGCAFCETGKMGLFRSLTTSEILSQVFRAKFDLGIEVRNIVFMGMGEPFDNFEAVMQAVKILNDDFAFGLGMSRITISTSGIVKGIYRLIEEADPALNLAVSINAPNDAIRNKLMPVNRQHDMEALKKAMQAYCSHPRRKILIEYVLIKGKTDELVHADELAAYLNGLNVTVNLIPYNPQSRSIFSTPDKNAIEAFAARMRAKGYLTFVRSTKGEKTMAACGQLGNLDLRKQKKSLVFSQESGILAV